MAFRAGLLFGLIGGVMLAAPSASEGQTCRNVPDGTRRFYQQILDKPGVSLRAGQAMRSSRAYRGQPVTFVSFEADGPGLQGTGDIATWATFGKMPTLERPVLSLAVEGLASRLSTYGTAGDTPVRSSSHPGVSQSQNCVRKALQPKETRPARARQRSGYSGPYDPNGPDRDCGDFRTQAQAQTFFRAAGGPARDPHRLDGDNDGVACESLP